MASRIIETYEIGTEITRLVKNSQRRIRLVSPFLNLKPWKHLEDAIIDAGQRKVDIQLIYRKDKREEYKPTIDGFLRAGVKVFDWDRLHAKLYLGDSSVIITSMNLDASSANNSEEFAMISDEQGVVGEISKYVERLFGSSQAQALTLESRGAAIKQVLTNVVAVAKFSQGACIRCDKKVALNTARPLCPDCFKSWVKYEDEDYPEKFCHTCAKPSRTSVRKPVCAGCYAKGY